MGKAETTTTNQVDPWIPSQDQFNQFKDRAAGLMTPEFLASLSQAGQSFNKMQSQAPYAPGFEQTLKAQMTPGKTDGFFNQVTGQGAPGLSAGYNQAMAGAMNASVNPLLNKAAGSLSQAAPAAELGQAVNRTMNAGIDPGLDKAAQAALNAGIDPRFDQLTGQATRGLLDTAFDKATTAAQNPQYARGFQSTVQELQDPAARSEAFGQVKRNVADQVLQDVNATFAGAGMTGSTLHQQNLAKGLTAGLASVENDAFQQSRDRALQAAQVGQAESNAQRQFGLTAANARQDAANQIGNRQLQGAGMIQDAQAALRQQALAAGSARNEAANALRGQQLQGAGLLQDAQNNARGQALQGAQALQAAEDSTRAQAVQAASAQQAAQANNYSQNLQAAGMRQDAYGQSQDRAINSANLLNTAYGQDIARRMALAQAQQGLGSQYQANFQNALQGLFGSATSGASQSTTQSQNPGLMGYLGAGLQMASLFSDERLKTDIKKVGKLDDGTPVFTYKYKDGVAPEFQGKTLMGVMADKVKNPKAVEKDPSGFSRVNYGAL